MVFENLYDEGNGWGWERHVVTLKPPDGWHSEGWGNHSVSSIDYKLTRLSEEETRFDMNWKSKPGMTSHGKGPSKIFIERYVAKVWRKRAKYIEAEFRKESKRYAPRKK